MTQVLIEKATLEQIVEALEGIEALIEHQYTGTREGMNALQNASDDAQEALTAGLAALVGAEPTGWQPIETAPKDGTRVLIKGDGTTQVAGYGRVTGCDFDSWVIANDVHIPNPTHWMKKP